MNRLTISQRLTLTLAVLLTASFSAWAVVYMNGTVRLSQEVVQRLSKNLAPHIAASSPLMLDDGVSRPAVRELFASLMTVNPSVEVYILDAAGTVVEHASDAALIQKHQVGLGPVRAFIAGDALPILGDDPKSSTAQKVFSAAPLAYQGRTRGYVYVVLHGSDYDVIAAELAGVSSLRNVAAAMLLVLVAAVLVGAIVLRWITQPLRELTDVVSTFRAVEQDSSSSDAAAGDHGHLSDELMSLRQAFERMAERIDVQMQELATKDLQLRELVANVSHDLRSPITTVRGYLEALRHQSDSLSDTDRNRYIDVALGQSARAGQMAQELFELAQLEYEEVEPILEATSVTDLIQDVFQKLEIIAVERSVQLDSKFEGPIPLVIADLGMLERALTNLIDNAIRHSPVGGLVAVFAHANRSWVELRISDNGSGIPPELQPYIFTRPIFGRRPTSPVGGLGLLIVHRLLRAHGTEIRLLETGPDGTTFAFRLASAPDRATNEQSAARHLNCEAS